jgi:hypothetical protein
VYPTQDLFRAMLELLAADTATLSPAADELHLHLVVNSIIPGRALVIGDLTLATFPGYASLVIPLGDQAVGFDPVRGEWFIGITEPEGGFRWQANAAVDPTQTAFAVALTDNTDADLYGAALLPTPVLVQSDGDVVEIGFVRLYEGNLFAQV